MEGIEMENETFLQNQCDGDFSDDICARILSRFSNAADEHHLHVCTTVGAMTQELKEQNLPLKPLTYFGAACSSLHRLATASETETPGHIVDALVTLLSLVISEFEDFNDAVLRKKFDFLSDVLMRVLRLRSIGPNGIVPGLKCVSLLFTSVRENVVWDNVSQLYGVLVSYITDDRTKVTNFISTHCDLNFRLNFCSWAFCFFDVNYCAILLQVDCFFFFSPIRLVLKGWTFILSCDLYKISIFELTSV